MPGAHLQSFVANNKKTDDGTKSDESRGAEPTSKKTESKKEAPAKSESVDEDEEAVYL